MRRLLLLLATAVVSTGCAAATAEVPHSIEQAAGCYVIHWTDSAGLPGFPDTVALVARREPESHEAWRAAWQVRRTERHQRRSPYVWAWRARGDSIEMWEEASHHAHSMTARRTSDGLDGTVETWWTDAITARFTARRTSCLGFRGPAS